MSEAERHTAGRRIDRRMFLRLGGGAAGALAVSGMLGACAREQPPAAMTPSPSGPPQGLPEPVQALVDERIAAGARPALDVFQGGSNYLAGFASYVAFGLVAGGVPVVGRDATVWAVPDPAAAGARTGPVPAPWYGYARPPAPPLPQGVNAADLTFDTPGIWYVVAETDTGSDRLVGTAAYQVLDRERSTTPHAGMKALPSETPTVADPHGVDPICTREPACDMHQVTLAAALGQRKPVVFAVGTPKFCSSRVCGPNIDEVLAVKAEVGDRAAFVHAEVYVDDEAETIQFRKVTETFRAWGFNSEPWLFVIRTDGTIADRFEGPLTAARIRTALNPLL